MLGSNCQLDTLRLTGEERLNEGLSTQEGVVLSNWCRRPRPLWLAPWTKLWMEKITPPFCQSYPYFILVLLASVYLTHTIKQTWVLSATKPDSWGKKGSWLFRSREIKPGTSKLESEHALLSRLSADVLWLVSSSWSGEFPPVTNCDWGCELKLIPLFPKLLSDRICYHCNRN